MTGNLPATKGLNLVPIDIPEELMTQMQETIDLCIPAATNPAQTLNDSLVIANGLNMLRAFFENEEVKKLVLTMKDSSLGFLTDREPKALYKTNAKKSAQYQKDPYSYEEIVEALIPPMMEGYRFTGNEINIINGKGMPVKNGKHRKITELTKGFAHVVGGPVKEGKVAKMKCQAKWFTKGGREQSIGYGDDPCIIHVEYDDYSGIDKLIGLAESKLFSRVLTRISGKLVIEGDVPEVSDKELIGDSSNGAKNIMDMEVDETKADKAFVNKLKDVVDDPDYENAIKTLIQEGKVVAKQGNNDLRTEDESRAKEVFELIMRYKGFEDSEAAESAAS